MMARVKVSVGCGNMLTPVSESVLHEKMKEMAKEYYIKT